MNLLRVTGPWDLNVGMLNAENVFSDLTPKKKTVLDAEHEPLGV